MAENPVLIWPLRAMHREGIGERIELSTRHGR
jgi:hypothetical protein